uniref:Tetraspanin n=1 Tax=Plectus sambesii TaxID=2011161 RepID=A0A914WZZ9_9BILA
MPTRRHANLPRGYYYRQPPLKSFISPTIKYFLFATNVLFWLGGLLLIAIGVWALLVKEVEQAKRITSAWDVLFDGAILITALGTVVVFFATVGCVGALRENTCFLKTFWIALVFVMLALLGVAATGLVMNSVVLDKAKDSIFSEKWIQSYFEDADLKDLTDFMQQTFSCCGMSEDGYKDWRLNPYFACNKTNKDVRRCSVPHSCCLHSNKNTLENFMCGAAALSKSTEAVTTQIHTDGCIDAVAAYVRGYVIVISGVCLALFVIPMLQIWLAVLLATQIEDQKRRWLMSHRPTVNRVPANRYQRY